MNAKGIKIAALIAALGVAIGAFGAHGLQKMISDPKLLDSWETAVKYQMYHAFAIAIVAILQYKFTSKLLANAIPVFVLGILLFSGSIYALVFLKATSEIGLGGLGIITPIGGVLLIVGWLMMLFGVKSTK